MQPGVMEIGDSSERLSLLAALSVARDHVLSQVTSMDPADLRRSVVPSGWTPLGLVRHLTLSDERYWFEVVMGGGPLDFWPEEAQGDWLVPEGHPAVDVIDAYRRAIAASDVVISMAALDTQPRRPEPEWASTGAFATLRDILLHMIIETSTHAGQLDVARELVDGQQYIVL